MSNCLTTFFIRHLICQMVKQRGALCVSEKNGVILHRDANMTEKDE